MRDREGGTWERAAEVLSRIAHPQQGHGSPGFTSASSARRWAWSSSASAGSGRKESGSADPAVRDYVRAVLGCYLWLPGTATVTSRHDRSCAQQLYRRGVPLDLVRAAMVVAVARRTFRRGDPLPRVRAVHYFMPVVEELREFPCDPGYVQYLEHQLRPLADAKAAQSGGKQTSPSS
jgi:hypothetical protein